MYRSILVPVDASPRLPAAVREAVRLASISQSKLVLLHVVPPVTRRYTDGLSVVETPEQQEARAAAAEETAWQLLEQAAALASWPDAESHVAVNASPSEAILEASRLGLCDAIVMAARRMGGVAGTLLGSQTQQVIEKSSVPVMVVH